MRHTEYKLAKFIPSSNTVKRGQKYVSSVPSIYNPESISKIKSNLYYFPYMSATLLHWVFVWFGVRGRYFKIQPHSHPTTCILRSLCQYSTLWSQLFENRRLNHLEAWAFQNKASRLFQHLKWKFAIKVLSVLWSASQFHPTELNRKRGDEECKSEHSNSPR